MGFTIRSDQKQSRSAVIRAATALALHPQPIRTSRAANQVEGIGESLTKLLKENEEKPANKKSKWGAEKPDPGKYSSPAVAVLVTMLEHIEKVEERVAEQSHGSISAGTTVTLALERLLAEASEKLESGRSFGSVESIVLGNEFDCAWEQVKVLMSTDESKCFLKRRQRKSQGGSGVALELTPAGRVLAARLRAQALHGPSRGPLLGSESSGGPVKLLVDFREGGGEKHKLFDLCRDLELQGVPFEVRSLPVGDFLFQAAAYPDRCAVFPVIIERKTAEDLALSMIDGRWESQKARMLASRESLAFSAGASVELSYVIEGNLKKARAGCCPRGCLSRCGGPTLEEVSQSLIYF